MTYVLLSFKFFARRDDVVLRIALSVSAGTNLLCLQKRPLADAQGYPPPRNCLCGADFSLRGA